MILLPGWSKCCVVKRIRVTASTPAFEFEDRSPCLSPTLLEFRCRFHLGLKIIINVVTSNLLESRWLRSLCDLLITNCCLICFLLNTFSAHVVIDGSVKCALTSLTTWNHIGCMSILVAYEFFL